MVLELRHTTITKVRFPDSIKTEIENIKAGIIDGSISTGW